MEYKRFYIFITLRRRRGFWEVQSKGARPTVKSRRQLKKRLSFAGAVFIIWKAPPTIISKKSGNVKLNKKGRKSRDKKTLAALKIIEIWVKLLYDILSIYNH